MRIILLCTRKCNIYTYCIFLLGKKEIRQLESTSGNACLKVFFLLYISDVHLHLYWCWCSTHPGPAPIIGYTKHTYEETANGIQYDSTWYNVTRYDAMQRSMILCASVWHKYRNSLERGDRSRYKIIGEKVLVTCLSNAAIGPLLIIIYLYNLQCRG